MEKICKSCQQSVIAHRNDCAWLVKKLKTIRPDVAKLLFYQLTEQDNVPRGTAK